MENRENNNNEINAKAIKNNLKPRGDHISQKIDFSAIKGMKLFPLFDRREDNYIYEKRFYNDLPKDLVFPKAFNLNSNINNFAKFDMMTMLFGLKKSQDLLTNSRLNTNIHQDFISNSLQLIFPENKFEFKDKSIFQQDKLDDKKRLGELKQEILEIIESKDESEKKEKESNPKVDDAFYLRNTMLLGSHLNVNMNNISKYSSSNAIIEKREKVDNTQKSVREEYIKSLEKTFEESEKIYEGMPHPNKKGITACKVYKVFPFFEFDENSFSQIIFPEDPADINTSNKLNEPAFKAPGEENNKGEKNEKFILRRKEDENKNVNINQVFSLFKSEIEDDEQIEKLKEDLGENNLIKSKVNFYNYERDYAGNIQNKEEELFNRFLIFINKTDKTAKILPLYTKLFLQKHKLGDKATNLNQDYENEDDRYYLNKKRERDIAIIPKNIDLEDIRNRNNSFQNSGFIKQYSTKAENIENIELERIPKNRKRTESHIKDKEIEENEDDDLFGKEFNSDAHENSEDHELDYEDEKKHKYKGECSNQNYEEENYHSEYSSA